MNVLCPGRPVPAILDSRKVITPVLVGIFCPTQPAPWIAGWVDCLVHQPTFFIWEWERGSLIALLCVSFNWLPVCSDPPTRCVWVFDLVSRSHQLELKITLHCIIDQSLRLLDPMPCAVLKMCAAYFGTAGMFIWIVWFRSFVQMMIQVQSLFGSDGKVEVGHTLGPHE